MYDGIIVTVATRDFVPTTDLERAYVQASQWALPKIERRALFESEAGNTAMAAGYFLAFVGSALLSNQPVDLKEFDAQLCSIVQGLKFEHKKSTARVLLHLVAGLLQHEADRLSSLVPLLQTVRTVLEECGNSIEVVPLWLDLAQLTEPLENRYEFTPEHGLVSGTVRNQMERLLSGDSPNIDVICVFDELTHPYAAVSYFEKLLHKHSENSFRANLLCDGLKKLLDRYLQNEKLNLNVLNKLQDIAWYLESTKHFEEAINIYQAIINEVIEHAGFELTARVVRGLVTCSIVADNLTLLHTTCATIAVDQRMDESLRRYADLQLAHYGRLFQAEKEFQDSFDAREEDPLRHFRSLIELSLVNLNLRRIAHVHTCVKITQLVFESHADVRRQYLDILTFAFSREKSGTPMGAAGRAIIYPILERHSQLGDLDLKSFSAQIEGAIRRHNDALADQFQRDSVRLLSRHVEQESDPIEQDEPSEQKSDPREQESDPTEQESDPTQ